jgi:hypothetical protein
MGFYLLTSEHPHQSFGSFDEDTYIKRLRPVSEFEATPWQVDDILWGVLGTRPVICKKLHVSNLGTPPRLSSDIRRDYVLCSGFFFFIISIY